MKLNQECTAMSENETDAGRGSVTLDDLLAGRLPDERGRFGEYGGRFVPETLMPALSLLEAGAREAMADPAFRTAFEAELKDWIGRPTPLTRAGHLSESWGGEVWLKREDLAHTGAHKINNAIGQALLARRMGAQRVIAETGAGQHGVASAAACARLGIPCTVYMGEVDAARQRPNLQRMKLLGAEVVEVTSGDGQAAQQPLSITVNAPPVLQPTDFCNESPANAIATFEDANLEGVVRAALAMSVRSLTCVYLAQRGLCFA